MAEAAQPPVVKSKLAASRAELLAAIGYDLAIVKAPESPEVPDEPVLVPTVSAQASPTVGRYVRRGMLANWWHRHPMSGAVELAEPYLRDIARREPAKLMAYSAGAGAALVLLKPWRILSAWTVLALLVKTINFTGLAADLVRRDGRALVYDDTLPPLG